ncbi:MAG: hypothetical protein IKN08_01850 [Bacteroidales bacterium]|nr:hypothetical protein [Bacteroidales bacterium]MBR6227581.1 hypothetical protein [Bacteroidales bacterium]
MNISIGYIATNLSINNTTTLKLFSDNLNCRIKEHDYGTSIYTFYISFICVLPDFESFLKPRRPKYIEYEETIIDGRLCKFERTFECELKLDYSIMSKATEEEAKKIVAQSIIEFLHVLKMPKKVTDFDKDRFVADMEAFFREEQLMD